MPRADSSSKASASISVRSCPRRSGCENVPCPSAYRSPSRPLPARTASRAMLVAGSLPHRRGEQSDDDAMPFRAAVRAESVRARRGRAARSCSRRRCRPRRRGSASSSSSGARRDAEEHRRTPGAVGCFDDRDPGARPGERCRIGDADEAEVQRRETLAQAGHGAPVGRAPGNVPAGSPRIRSAHAARSAAGDGGHGAGCEVASVGHGRTLPCGWTYR